MVRTRLIRRLSLLLLCVAALGLVWLSGPSAHTASLGSIGSYDFIQYWSAAQLLLGGADPYDATALLAMEQGLGWAEPGAVLMWNPPWTLAIVLPIALLPFGLAIQIWLVLQLTLILGSGLFLWRYFSPEDTRYWIGLLLAVGFVPGPMALIIGQISPWLLTGVVVFLCAQRSRRDLLAGAGLALLMIKPHVAYLFWLAALWWAWRSRRWHIAIGWLAALAGASLLVLFHAPGVFHNYLTAAATPPLHWITPTLGGWLRLFFGSERHWLQFLPPLAGALALLFCRWLRPGAWHWPTVAGRLLMASTVTAAFGWSVDQVVLLPVVIGLVARLGARSPPRRAAVLGAFVLSQLAFLALNWHPLGKFLHVLHPLVLAGLYWWGVGYDPADGVAVAPGAGSRGGCAWGT